MSCEQRENGKFTFKKTGYTQIMRATRNMFQALDNFNYEIALCLYNTLNESKIKKNKKASYEFIQSQISNNMYMDYNQEYRRILKKSVMVENTYCFEIDHVCINMALNEIFRNENNTRLKPRRSAYPKLTNKDKSFIREFNDLIWISFKEEDYSFEWTVRQGNKTVNDANNHYITGIFFKIVSEYNWKIGERGETVSVVENFDDNPCANDTVSETTRYYEKLSKKKSNSKKKYH
jgi:hypothetical protein